MGKDWIYDLYIEEVLPLPLSYQENGKKVFTAQFHLKRGFCCGSKCRHCPYVPAYEKGNTNI